MSTLLAYVYTCLPVISPVQSMCRHLVNEGPTARPTVSVQQAATAEDQPATLLTRLAKGGGAEKKEVKKD